MTMALKIVCLFLIVAKVNSDLNSDPYETEDVEDCSEEYEARAQGSFSFVASGGIGGKLKVNTEGIESERKKYGTFVGTATGDAHAGKVKCGKAKMTSEEETPSVQDYAIIRQDGDNYQYLRDYQSRNSRIIGENVTKLEKEKVLNVRKNVTKLEKENVLSEPKVDLVK